MEQELSLLIVFAAGLLSFLSPCVLPLFPGYIGLALQHHIGEAYQNDLARQINEIAYNIPGVNEVFCQVGMPYYT